MHCTDVETVTARKPHKCMSCGEAIETGDQYKKWVSFDDGSACTNKMHPECYAMHGADSDGYDWEYLPYSYDRPERHNDKVSGATRGA